MATRRVTQAKSSTSRRPPATTPEGRENQLIELATDLAEKQLRDGTASSQVITQILKLGTTREKIEQERLRMEVELGKVKMAGLESQARVEEMYTLALNAMRAYSGQPPLELQDDSDY